MRERAYGPVNADVAASVNNLGLLYLAQGRHAEAEPLLRRSLAIREQVRHPNVAGSVYNLAALLQAAGRYAEAEALFLRLLAMREQSVGTGHPSYAAALESLALLYVAQGRDAEAQPLLQRAAEIGETGSRSPGAIPNSPPHR